MMMRCQRRSFKNLIRSERNRRELCSSRFKRRDRHKYRKLFHGGLQGNSLLALCPNPRIVALLASPSDRRVAMHAGLKWNDFEASSSHRLQTDNRPSTDLLPLSPASWSKERSCVSTVLPLDIFHSEVAPAEQTSDPEPLVPARPRSARNGSQIDFSEDPTTIPTQTAYIAVQPDDVSNLFPFCSVYGQTMDHTCSKIYTLFFKVSKKTPEKSDFLIRVTIDGQEISRTFLGKGNHYAHDVERILTLMKDDTGEAFVQANIMKIAEMVRLTTTFQCTATQRCLRSAILSGAERRSCESRRDCLRGPPRNGQYDRQAREQSRQIHKAQKAERRIQQARV